MPSQFLRQATLHSSGKRGLSAPGLDVRQAAAQSSQASFHMATAVLLLWKSGGEDEDMER